MPAIEDAIAIYWDLDALAPDMGARCGVKPGAVLQGAGLAHPLSSVPLQRALASGPSMASGLAHALERCKVELIQVVQGRRGAGRDLDSVIEVLATDLSLRPGLRTVLLVSTRADTARLADFVTRAGRRLVVWPGAAAPQRAGMLRLRSATMA